MLQVEYYYKGCNVLNIFNSARCSVTVSCDKMENKFTYHIMYA